ncbi:MAG: RDD family protein [Pyrinomonadaceae bacterium]
MAVCATCGTNNVEGTKFCVSCGAALSQAPAPGSWRTPTEELHGQTPGATTGGGSSGPVGYTPTSAPPQVYAPPAGAPMFGAPPSGMPFAQMRYAEWIDRVFAALIDGALGFALTMVLYIAVIILTAMFGAIGGDVGEALALGSACLGFSLVFISVLGLGLYNKVYLVSKRGFSIGQGIMKLKVVDAAGNIPPIGTLILRLVVQIAMGIVPFLPLVNLLWPLWDEQKQTLHDKAAGTFVIKTG